MHYHLLKKETWYIAKGQFEYHWINTESATPKMTIVNEDTYWRGVKIGLQTAIELARTFNTNEK